MSDINIELARLINLVKEAEQYNKREDTYRTSKTLKAIKRKLQKIMIEKK
tara:strand:- start:2838 stop:2987 length:150 start_codon:yes stop_codon:yes gene_type:complete